jgi:pSer/pThr/pTyr-binding forkhead associated (FHA) protein
MSSPDLLSETLQGRDIVEEVLHNSEQGQFEFSERVIVPAVYHIYLDPADFDRLEPIVPAIEEECKAALNRRLRELNRKRFGRKLVQFGIQADDWDVRVLADHHEDAAAGRLKVVSRLAPSQDKEFVGAVTVRVKRPAAAKATAASGTVPTGPVGDAGETRKVSDQGTRWAALVFRDDEGEKTFGLHTPDATIGRASSVEVVIRNDRGEVSRQHCRIRRDGSGSAFLSDLGSANGTLLDGIRLEPHAEAVLRDGAQISLANGAVLLHFTRKGA